MEELFEELSRVKGVKDSSYLYLEKKTIQVPVNNLNKEYIDYFRKFHGENYPNRQTGHESFNAEIYFIDNSTYEKYLSKNSYDKDLVLNMESPLAVVRDFSKFYIGAEGKFYTFHILGGDPQDIQLRQIKEIEGYIYNGEETDDAGRTVYYFRNRYAEIGEEEL